MGYELFIQNGATLYYPAVEEGVSLSWERKGTPGTLNFTVLQDAALHFQEGNPVKFVVDGVTMFYGFIFRKKRKANQNTVEVVAYDQTRYLKNKDTVVEEGLTASQLLKRLAEDFRLNLGTVEDTGYVIPAIVEENVTLFDMMQSALDETLLNTGQLFCLYDEGGALTLKNINSLKLNLLIDEETAETFDYESSIDEQTYNKIKLVYNNNETGKQDQYVAQDGEKMNTWGVLQYLESVQTPIGAAEKAQALLKLYGQKTKSLTISSAFGDSRVRAGSAVMVSLNLGDMSVNTFLMVERVTHRFKQGSHFMDLTLVGGEFIA